MAGQSEQAISRPVTLWEWEEEGPLIMSQQSDLQTQVALNVWTPSPPFVLFCHQGWCLDDRKGEQGHCGNWKTGCDARIILGDL